MSADAGQRYVLRGPLPPLAIPTTLQDSLMPRLDRLAPVKEVAQLGAAIGRQFSYELLAAISPLPEREFERTPGGSFCQGTRTSGQSARSLRCKYTELHPSFMRLIRAL